MPYEPVVPKGQHLGVSHEVDGAATGHLFEDGTNDLKGHAAWRWVDEPAADYSSTYEHEPTRELTPEERELAANIAALILVGVVMATPQIMKWNKKAAQHVAATWRRVFSLRKSNRQVAPGVPVAMSPATFVASTTGVGIALAESKISMTGYEWAHRYQAMLAAGAFKDDQLRILSNARIVDDGGVVEGGAHARQLTAREFIDRVKLMLEANPSLLDLETSTELLRVFGSQRSPSTELREPHTPQ